MFHILVLYIDHIYKDNTYTPKSWRERNYFDNSPLDMCPIISVVTPEQRMASHWPVWPQSPEARVWRAESREIRSVPPRLGERSMGAVFVLISYKKYESEFYGRNPLNWNQVWEYPPHIIEYVFEEIIAGDLLIRDRGSCCPTLIWVLRENHVSHTYIFTLKACLIPPQKRMFFTYSLTTQL